MILIVCLEARGGISFHQRRLSMDSALRQRLLEVCGTNTLWMNPYSARQFQKLPGNVKTDPQYLQNAAPCDYCFLETDDVRPYLNKIDALIVYHWNRAYPFDQKFPLESLIKGSRPVTVFEFSGSSHDKITEEFYAF